MLPRSEIFLPADQQQKPSGLSLASKNVGDLEDVSNQTYTATAAVATSFSILAASALSSSIFLASLLAPPIKFFVESLITEHTSGEIWLSTDCA